MHLLVEFSAQEPGGKILGAEMVYEGGMDGKLIPIQDGDEIEFICDYYDYDGNYSRSFVLGDKIVIKDNLYLGDIELKDHNILASYEFKDVYQQAYYSSAVK